MKKNFKTIALVAILFTCVFALTHVLGVATHPTPLKNASFLWWPMSEEEFYATNKWAIPLKEGFEQNGYNLKIISENIQNPVEHLLTSDIIIVAYPIKKGFNLPYNHLKKGAKVYLWALESPIWKPQTLSKSDIRPFEKVFLWRPDLVDNQKKFFVPLDTRLEEGLKISKDVSHKRYLMMQIATNFYRPETFQALYNKRREATLWWLRNHPTPYAFYGQNWPMILEQADEELEAAFHNSYKGYAPDKIKALSESYFALAFENTRYPYYVTEKIFDVMKAGTVPVYLGAPNIEEFVPKECFINYDNFKNDAELYSFLKALTVEQYQAYLTCIQDFLSSDKIKDYTPEAIADSLLKEIF